MSKTFVIVSVSDRVNQLNDLVGYIARDNRFDEYDISLLFQDYLGTKGEIKYLDRYQHIDIRPERLGCNGARIELLKEISYDTYINLDDDMMLTEYTCYDRAIARARENYTGFVLTNWARTESLLMKKVPKMRDEFVRQIMVYQGGGMVYSDKIADLIRALPTRKTLFDDEWPITAYINGYDNYRYLGSLAVHRVCTTGGMHDFMRREMPPVACPQYINYRVGKSGHTLIPVDSDINEFARLLHHRRRADL